MMKDEAIPKIDKMSSTADVVAYVGLKLQHSEFVEDLKRFIEGHAINGIRFVTLNEEALLMRGLSPREKRECLLKLVSTVKK
jgi:hypothetical protein